jgi:prolyl 4-hydroxylase
MSVRTAKADYHKINEWLVEQIRAGQSADALLCSMRERGWAHDLAMGLIAQAMGVRSGARPATPMLEPVSVVSETQPSTSPAMPAPALDDASMYLDLGERKVTVLAALRQPQIVLFGDFLGKSECDRLVEMARPRMQRSLTTDVNTGESKLDDIRTSRGMFFRRGETPLVANIEARIARLVAWPVDHGEDLQVLHYRPGDRYEPHHDYFEPEASGTASVLARGGQRVATLLMYLREPERGGETTFPELGLRFSPKRGSALFFSYERPHPSTKTLHGGAPVLAGEKWVATKWLRERVFA